MVKGLKKFYYLKKDWSKSYVILTSHSSSKIFDKLFLYFGEEVIALLESLKFLSILS